MLVYLSEAGAFGEFPEAGLYHHNLENLLRIGYSRFSAWKKNSRLACSQPRFTAARCNRTSRTSWACLSSKAHAGKVLTFWLMHEITLWAGRPEATDLDGRIAACVWCYCELLRLMDVAGPVFDEDQATEFHQKGLRHLQLYSALRHQSSRVLGAQSPMRYLFQLIPKHHYFFHMVLGVQRERLNPRHYTLLCAESWVGMVGRMARTTHRSSLSLRVLQRYLVKLGVHVSRIGAT